MRLYRPHPALRAAVQQARLRHPEMDVPARWPLVPNFFYYIEDVRVSHSHRDMTALQAVATLVGYAGPLTEPEPEAASASRGRLTLTSQELV